MPLHRLEHQAGGATGREQPRPLGLECGEGGGDALRLDVLGEVDPQASVCRPHRSQLRVEVVRGHPGEGDRMPAPHGIRMTNGQVKRPRVRLRKRDAWLTI